MELPPFRRHTPVITFSLALSDCLPSGLGLVRRGDPGQRCSRRGCCFSFFCFVPHTSLGTPGAAFLTEGLATVGGQCVWLSLHSCGTVPTLLSSLEWPRPQGLPEVGLVWAGHFLERRWRSHAWQMRSQAWTFWGHRGLGQSHWWTDRRLRPQGLVASSLQGRRGERAAHRPNAVSGHLPVGLLRAGHCSAFCESCRREKQENQAPRVLSFLRGDHHWSAHEQQRVS